MNKVEEMKEMKKLAKEEVLATFKSRPSEYISSAELCKRLGVHYTTVWAYIKELKKEETGGSFESLPGKGTMWVPIVKEKTVEEQIKETTEAAIKYFSKPADERVRDSKEHLAAKLMFGNEQESKEAATKLAEEMSKAKKGKNHEGYNDPTATNAIDNVEPEDKKEVIVPNRGEVWIGSRANSRLTDLYLVLRNFGDNSLCVVIENRGVDIPPEYLVVSDTWRLNCSKICTKPNRYLKERSGVVTTGTLKLVGNIIAGIIGIEAAMNEEAIRKEYEQKFVTWKMETYEKILFGNK